MAEGVGILAENLHRAGGAGGERGEVGIGGEADASVEVLVGKMADQFIAEILLALGVAVDRIGGEIDGDQTGGSVFKIDAEVGGGLEQSILDGAFVVR